MKAMNDLRKSLEIPANTRFALEGDDANEQMLLRLPNDFGVSVLCGTMSMSRPDAGLFEAALVRFDGKGMYMWDFCNDPSQQVEGFVDAERINEMLRDAAKRA